MSGNETNEIVQSRDEESNKIEEEKLEIDKSVEPKEKVTAGKEDGEVIQEKEGEIEAEPEEISEEEPIKKQIIVVDSDEKSLDKTIKELRKGEYLVVGVESAKEFFEVTWADTSKKADESKKEISGIDEYYGFIKGRLPEMIITDLDLKDLDGWEFIFRLKFEGRYYEYRDIPIIVLTKEKVTADTPKKLQAESIHDYLPKSLKGKELLKKVDSYFETREKLSQTKSEYKKFVGHAVAGEYERLSLGIRIRLKYLQALKNVLTEMEKSKGDPTAIKKLEEIIFLEKRNIMKYEKRRREIKHIVKVKKDAGGTAAKSETPA